MPSLDLYKKMMGANKTVGMTLKSQSDAVMEATWFNDRNTHTCYLYDYYHDEYKRQLKGLHPESDPNKIAISLKVRTSSQQTYSKDAVTHHIQMMPSQEMNIPYYPDAFGNRYDAEFPVGLYCDVPDDKGTYRRWLVVGLANFYDAFPTYEILPCDKIYDWVWHGKKINMAGVQRSQNSYNSGTYLDYKIERVENQSKLILPINSISEKLYYNQRMIVDNKVDVLNGAEPRAWRVTKIERTNPNGIVNLTLYQDAFDQHHDFIEYADKNDPSSIIGMYADYYSSPTVPEDINKPIDENLHGEIKYNGKAQINVGGSAKKLSIHFYNGETETDYIPGSWKFTVNDEDVTTLLSMVDDDTLPPNTIKCRFNGSLDYLGEILVVTYETTTGIITQLQMKIGG